MTIICGEHVTPYLSIAFLSQTNMIDPCFAYGTSCFQIMVVINAENSFDRSCFLDMLQIYSCCLSLKKNKIFYTKYFTISISTISLFVALLLHEQTGLHLNRGLKKSLKPFKPYSALLVISCAERTGQGE